MRPLPHGRRICRRGRNTRPLRVSRRITRIRLMRLVQTRRGHRRRSIRRRISRREPVLISRRAAHALQPRVPTCSVLLRVIRSLLAGEGGCAQDPWTRRACGIGTRRAGKLLGIIPRVQGVSSRWRRGRPSIHEQLVVLALRGAVCAVWECTIVASILLLCAVGEGVVAGDVAQPVVAVLLVWRGRLLAPASAAVGILLPVVMSVRHAGRS